MQHTVLNAQQAREKILEGVNYITDVVKVTMGKKGQNVMCLRPNMLPVFTKDGVSVAREITHPDPIVNAGCLLIKQVATSVVDLAGDGTTQSSVLTQSIVNNAQEALQTTNSIEIQRGIEYASKKAVELLKTFVKPVDTPQLKRQITSVSSNDDLLITNLVLQAVEKAGLKGIVKVEESFDNESKVETSLGYQFDSPLSSHLWINNHEKFRAEFSDMNVFIYEGFLEEREVRMVMEALERNPTEKIQGILFIADNIDNDLEQKLLSLKSNGYKVLFAKSPYYGSQRTEALQDIASVVGSQVFSSNNHFTGDVSVLGNIEKVEIDFDATLLIGGKGDISERVKVVSSQLEEYKGANKTKEIIEERLAKLLGGVAKIKIAAHTIADRQDKMDRIDDAKKSLVCAMEEGYVAGGGTTYLFIAEKMKKEKVSERLKKGYDIFVKSLEEPFNTIYTNAQLEVDKKEVTKRKYGTGVDIYTGKIVNLFNEGIIDSAKVVRVAIEKSAGIASIFLSQGGLVFNNEQIFSNT